MPTRSPERLLRAVETVLCSIPDPSHILVAYSGGRDSHLLLWLVSRLRERFPVPLGAVHVHHGLQAAADAWQTHCDIVCRDLGVPLEVVRVDARPEPGQSPEDAARKARYGVLDERISAGGLLLTAHHEDDQAETLLLQLLRGSGPEGLAAMPLTSPIGAGTHVRPMLEVSRAEIEACATQLGLHWIEDPSNQDRAFDRNRLRHDIVPLLKSHWPAFSRTLARSARHCAEAVEVLRETAGEDLARCVVPDAPDVLSIEAVRALSDARQTQVLRLWVRKQGFPVPTAAHIDQIRSAVLAVDLAHRSPRVRWSNAMVCAWRDGLYLGDRAALDHRAGDDVAPVVWPSGNRKLVLPDGEMLEQVVAHGQGIRRALFNEGLVTVGFRRGGERLRLPGESHQRRLKQLLQDSDLPPWRRARLPLIYIDGVLAAIADRWVCAPFATGEGDEGVRIIYEP